MKVSTNRISIAAAFLYAICNLMLVQVSNAMYFYAEQDVWRCFQDTVVSNYVSSLHDK